MKISVLVASRMNSRFLAQFIMGYLNSTADPANTELLVMHSADDTCNQPLIEYCSAKHLAQFYPESMGLGRQGHHVYFNELAKKSPSDWYLTMCEDMAFITPGWDNLLREFVRGMDPSAVWAVCPTMKPVSHAMVHLLSRGYLTAAGNIAECWSVDSWINNVFERCPDRIKSCDVSFYDYSHEPGNAFLVDRQPARSPEADEMPEWGSQKTNNLLSEVSKKICPS